MLHGTCKFYQSLAKCFEYLSICSNILIFALHYFSLTSSKSFHTCCCLFVFHSMLSKSFQADCRCFHSRFTFPAISILPSSVRSESFLIHFFISLLYINPFFLSMNSSVLILFLIAEVITGILAQHSHLILACNCRLQIYSS